MRGHYKKGADMQTLANTPTAQINAEYDRAIRAAMSGQLTPAQRRQFATLRAEWRKRQGFYNN